MTSTWPKVIQGTKNKALEMLTFDTIVAYYLSANQNIVLSYAMRASSIELDD